MPRPQILHVVVFALVVGVGCRRVVPSEPADSFPAAAEEPKRALTGSTLVFVGDVLLADGAQPLLDRQGYDAPFASVRPLLQGDVVVGNAEGPITERTEKFFPQQKWSYNARPAAAPALARAGFHALSVANNHMLDRGPMGLADSYRHLWAQGLTVGGGGRNLLEASKPILVATPAGPLAILAMTQRWNRHYPATTEAPGALIAGGADSAAAIASARAAGARWVVPYVHWGANYAGVDDKQREIARALVDAGADLIVGHHPHVIQGVELVNGRPVFWSLGNFVFGTPGRFTSEHPGYGAVLRLRVDERGPVEAELRCVDVDNRRVKYVPRPCTSSQVPEAFARLGPGPTLDGDVARWRWNEPPVSPP